MITNDRQSGSQVGAPNPIPRQVAARIRAAYSTLSEAEQQVADAFEADPEAMVNLPVKTLAKRIGVSDATIIRFAQTLGYAGLRQMKLAIAAEALTPHSVIHQAIAPGDDLQTLCSKVLGSNMQALADTMAMVDLAALQRAVDALLGATRIELYGIGSSVPIALDAYYRFLRIGLPVTVVTDPHMQALSASQLPVGSVAFFVSHTGRTAEIRTVMKRAREAGVFCLLLTSYSNTPAGELADIQLITASPNSLLRPEAVSSRIAHLALVDVLSVVMAVYRPELARETLVRDDTIIAEREMLE